MNFGKQTLVFSALLFALTTASAQTYSKARILVEDLAYDQLKGLGLALDHVYYTLDYVEGDFSNYELDQVRKAGYDIEIIEHDAEAAYAQSRQSSFEARSNQECIDELKSFGIQSPSNFHLGSYKGNFTLEEMQQELDAMHAAYPDLINARQDIGEFRTSEGRPIQWVRISDNPDIDESEPEILYTALHHAREPISLSQLIYFMWYVLENSATDRSINHLLKNTELYFIPCVNPDGYVYNQQLRPNGGGLWRKNRRPNPDGSYGVDLNRNYGHKWGVDNDGSSDAMPSEVYRGSAAFSEPETQAVRSFVLDHDFKVALNYHAYGGFLIYPWGYTSMPAQDEGIFKELGLLLTKDNRYTYGTGLETVSYTTNGDADDWMYGAADEKPTIFAMTPEIGTRDHGFWPAREDVEHLCQAALHQNIQAASFLLNSAKISNESEGYLTEKEGSIPIRITKLGFEDVGLNLSVKPVTDNIHFTTSSKLYILNLFARQRDHFDYILASDIQDGERIRFSVSVDNGSYTQLDTITTYYREADFALNNEGTMGDWQVDNLNSEWGITDKFYYSPPSSLTDSPNGNYVPYTSNYLTLREGITLTGKDSAILTFKALWDIQQRFDFLQVEVSTDAVNYFPLCGDLSSPGVPAAAAGLPVYSGRQLDWVSEQIDLSDYLGQTITLRFSMVSTSNDTRDGFYLDDIKVLQYDQGSLTDSEFLEAESFQSIIAPNPVSDQLTLQTQSYNMNLMEVRIYNQIGQLAFKSRYNDQLRIDVSQWAPGLYFLQYIDEENMKSRAKKFMVE